MKNARKMPGKGMTQRLDYSSMQENARLSPEKRKIFLRRKIKAWIWQEKRKRNLC